MSVGVSVAFYAGKQAAAFLSSSSCGSAPDTGSSCEPRGGGTFGRDQDIFRRLRYYLVALPSKPRHYSQQLLRIRALLKKFTEVPPRTCSKKRIPHSKHVMYTTWCFSRCCGRLTRVTQDTARSAATAAASAKHSWHASLACYEAILTHNL